MNNKWLPRPLSIILVVVAMFVALSNSLTGCTGGTPMARVFSNFDVSFSRSYEKSPEYQDFKKIYNRYTANNGTRAQQLKHFSAAFRGVRAK